MGRSRTKILSALILAILVLALFFAFSRTLFLDTAEVHIPPPETGGQTQPGSPAQEGPEDPEYLPVKVDKDTVQAVIASLSRPNSYDRDVTVETYWGESGYGIVKVHAWVSGGFTRIQSQLPGGGVRNVITGDGKYYLWYDGDEDWFETDAGTQEDDIAQQIPTYENILAVSPDRILEAGYLTLSNIDCIYVELEEDSLGYRERYWVSVESGLLVCSETEKDGRVVYRMSSFSVNIPYVGANVFVLPDGTDLLSPPVNAKDLPDEIKGR